nr:transposase [Acaryochloris marina]
MPETDAIFANLKHKDLKDHDGTVKRLSIDCKATVELGASSRRGKTRTQTKACDHDMGSGPKYIPCGILEEDTDTLHIIFGHSHKTSDFMVDNLQDWWNTLAPTEQQTLQLIQIKLDNGPENSGVRTQFLNRLVAFSDHIGTAIQLLYYPPYHSKYNPIERCWGIVEQHWNGTLLTDVDTLLGWASTMTWKGNHPVVTVTQKIYETGISLTKQAMKGIEKRLERHPQLPKWDILIHPI